MGMHECPDLDAGFEPDAFIHSDASLDATDANTEDVVARELCSARTSRTLRCGDVPMPLDACVQLERCRLAEVRDDVRMFVSACVEGLACDESESTCFVPERLGLATSAVADAFVAECRMNLSACVVDECEVTAQTDEAIGALGSCLELPCDEALECLDPCDAAPL